MSVTGIVLAGGRSTRFGGDKLAADLDETSVLATTVNALGAVVDRVIVAGPALPDRSTSDVPIALVPDRAPFDGPLAALANVLEATRPESDDVAIVVGGDMPRLVPRVLVAMVEALDASPSTEAVLLGRPGGPRHGRRQVLPLVVRVEPARRVALEAVEHGDRSLQSLVDRLALAELLASVWLRLDPAAATLTDIDTRADLDRLNVT